MGFWLNYFGIPYGHIPIPTFRNQNLSESLFTHRLTVTGQIRFSDFSSRRPGPASRARLQPPDTAAAPLQQSASQRCCSLVQDFRFSHLPTAIIILYPKSAAADECRCAAADQIKEFRRTGSNREKYCK
ncbi:Uncharacterized protein Fot_23849 [Forsythia ovata]|uniref:Uncharacterized protein n=1 Tax=Forsythia ovata TaxID=205694 RepID=A0ABD1U4J7_9LAMI